MDFPLQLPLLREGSDIDVAIISDDFKGMNLLERLEVLGLALAKAKITEPIEALGYTEEEFAAQGERTFVGDEIKAKGIEVKRSGLIRILEFRVT